MIRILTANLFNGRARPDSLAEVLDAASPDVVAAQELAPDAATVISERYLHGLVHPAFDYTGIALASRRPMDVRRHRLPYRDAMVGRMATEGNRVLTVWSAHLANPVEVPPPIRARRAQVRALKDAVAGGGPLVLVGDLNATPSWPAFRRLRKVLDDGVGDWASRAGMRAPATWSYTASLPPILRIDHVLVRGVRVLGARAVRIAGADHRAVVADLDVPEGAGSAVEEGDLGQ